MFFSGQKNEIEKSKKEKSIYALSSDYGRGISSLEAEITANFKEASKYNPIPYLRDGLSFIGLNHNTQEPLYLNQDNVIHTLITAPTRAGKGIYFGIKAVETLKLGKGLIILDPKEDEFLPQICKEELIKQNRENDFIVWNWPNDFGYKTFEDDNENEVTKKLAIMLSLVEKEDEAGASYYRKNERIALKKLIYLFFNSKELLEVEFKKDLPNFSKFIGYVVEDLINHIEYSKEKNKPKANIDLLEEYSKRYFNLKLFNKNILFKEKDISTLESLNFSLSEFENISFTENSSILGALTQGKCIYIKSDMLDESALKFLKFVIADIINKARKYKKKTNCIVIADEISFYPTSILSAALATIAGFGVDFILAYQDDGQLVNEHLKSAIKSNCQTKLYYKSSDLKTIEYIELLGGSELVTKFTINGVERTIKQEQESYLNINKQRALPKAKVGILIHESIPKPFIIDTAPVQVKEKFDWENINNKVVKMDVSNFNKKFDVLEKKKLSVEMNDNEVETTEKFEI